MNPRNLIIVLGLAFIVLAPYTALYEVYGVVLPHERAADLARVKLQSRSQSACAAVTDVELALAEFAANWLPPDQDYLRTHPHDDSELARFHANRVYGLSTLQKRMKHGHLESVHRIAR